MRKFRIIAMLAAAFWLGACGNTEDTGAGSTGDRPVVRMEVAGFGDITLELYPEYAPETVANFLGLVESGFYDGLTFHRIIDGFMIQGGDPDGNGTGGSGENIVGEFSANGHDNPLLHERGTISMARNMVSMDSASSQFFIMHQTGAFLDGDYAAFGRVIEGIEVVDAIVEAATAGQNGAVAPADQPVITRMVIE